MQKEINKLLKRISAAKLKKNHKECVELYNIVGGLYSEIGSYDEAIHYHEQALAVCKTIGDRLGIAIALRYIGEAKASLGQFYQAIDFIKKYLELAQKTNNKLEIQRAWTTLGRVYLMQAQDLKENSHVIDDKIKDAAQEAEKRFQTALTLAEQLRDQIDAKEFAQMQSGLLVNIGLIEDICGRHSQCVARFAKAIDICKKAKIKEDLYRCQVVLSGIFRQRGNVKMAASVCEDALSTAKQIGKKLLICDAYIEKGLVKILQRNFGDAKKNFAQAYLEKSPSEEDHSKAIRLTKISHLIAINFQTISNDGTPNETRMKLCDKLGDLFVSINYYKLAVEFYKRAFTDAKICSRPKSELAKILYSIAETYADDGQFAHALVCYEKELVYRNGNDSEQCQSLMKIAQMHELLNHNSDQVFASYDKALEKAGKNPKLMYNVLKDYLTYARKFFNLPEDKSFTDAKFRKLDDDLLNLKSYPEVLNEIDKVEVLDANDIEDEISNVDDIISDDEDNEEVLMIGRRKARGAKKFKPNEVGDTPLHEACIKGDIKRVKSLISQGHDINPRDNAGWIPLHEACNHGHYDIVECLLENGADVSNRGLKGMTPLHDAATNGHLEIMRLLIKYGANVIALTDAGETVLSCLRDYKQRNYSEMSNRNLTEYKHMEQELMNVMDKCGFNFMEESIKNFGSRKSKGCGSSAALAEVQTKPKTTMMNTVNPDILTNPVKDYRNVMGTLKRKRVAEESRPESVSKASQPAIYHTSSNTSAQTKDWLIDDVSREKRILKRRSNLQTLLDSDFENEDDGNDDLEKGEVSPVKNSKTFHSVSIEPKDLNVKRKIMLESDDEDEDPAFSDIEIEIITEKKKECSNDFGPIIMSPMPSCSPDVSFTREPSTATMFRNMEDRSNASFFLSENKSFNLLRDPLVVTIDDRKLIIPIKDEFKTIKWLKEAIVERYSTLVDAKPNISLSPMSDLNCILFDEDHCVDVIRENLVANIDSWKLEAIDESYSKHCVELGIEPLNFIKFELKRISNADDQLNLAFTRFPRPHIRPLARALAWRSFTKVDLTGASCLFEGVEEGREMMRTIGTWRRLRQLVMRCLGLGRHHLEALSGAGGERAAGEAKVARWSGLERLDLSYNSIAYKCKVEFKRHIERLIEESGGRLERLDMRRNHLVFVKSISSELLAGSSSGAHRLEGSGELDLVSALDMNAGAYGFQILGATDQSNYCVYSANDEQAHGFQSEQQPQQQLQPQPQQEKQQQLQQPSGVELQ